MSEGNHQFLGASGTLTETAFAKINLSLRTIGRRADGYHNLESLVVFAEAGDVLTWVPSLSEGVRLKITGPFAGDLSELPVEQNLVWRAASLFEEVLEIKLSGVLTLNKQVPVASGIGGGSADAAAVLRLLHRYYRSPVSLEDLAQKALNLGADVPMCFYANVGWVTGIGENIRPLSVPESFPQHILLINPGVKISTPQVFQNRVGDFSSSIGRNDLELWADLTSGGKRLQNDLLDAANSLCPAIEETLLFLEKQPGLLFSGMSGSGSTCFGLFDEPAQLRAAALMAQEDLGRYCSLQNIWVQTSKLL